MKNLNRRQMIVRSLQVAGAWLLAPAGARARAAESGQRFLIGACDWSIGKACDPGAFEVARQIGLDGVQVSLGTLANNMHLRQPGIQQRYREASQRAGVRIASLAIGELNEIPYKTDPRTVAWVSDAIDVCHALECRTILLAFFNNGDLKGDRPGTDEVVRRLKEVAPKAEKQGVALGLESWLSAEESMEILQRVGSPAVKVYYDVANSEKMGYDIYREIRWLGKQKAICEFHAKENDSLLGGGRVDFKKVRAAMDDIQYRGWMQIEGAIPPGGRMLESYQANLKYLRTVFPPGMAG